MNNLIKSIIYHPLFSGSVIMMVGSAIANLLTYLFHLVIGRLLGPSAYGELVSLISISGLLGVIPASVSLAVIKYISESRTEEDKASLISWLKAKTFQLSFIFFVTVVLIIPVIKSFLHISNVIYIFVTALTFLFSLPSLLNRSILQGLLKFKEIIISILTENVVKLTVSTILVYLGYSIGGVMFAFITSAAIGWYITNTYLKSYSRKKLKEASMIKPMILYAIPVAIQSIALTSLYSSDLILVKHFFPSHDAGIYASVSILGKIIFFAAGPIGGVMFPLVSQRYVSGGEYKKVFIYSFFATLILTILILMFYWLYPKFAINLLYGAAYLEAAYLLVWFGIFVTLFTLSSLLVSYQLSLGNTTVVLLPLAAAIAQAIGIWFYHENLFIVIVISILVTALLLCLLLIYSFHNLIKGGLQSFRKKVYKIRKSYETNFATKDKFSISDSTCI